MLVCGQSQLDGSFFRQVVGIPQGSVMSSLLCCMYLAHVERHCMWPQLDTLLRLDQTKHGEHTLDHPAVQQGDDQVGVAAVGTRCIFDES